MQANDKFWDMEDQHQPAAREALPQGTPGFEVEGPVDTKGLIRRIDRHLLPLLFSLALLCSIDRGLHTPPTFLHARSEALSHQASIHGNVSSQRSLPRAELMALKGKIKQALCCGAHTPGKAAGCCHSPSSGALNTSAAELGRVY